GTGRVAERGRGGAVERRTRLRCARDGHEEARRARDLADERICAQCLRGLATRTARRRGVGEQEHDRRLRLRDTRERTEEKRELFFPLVACALWGELRVAASRAELA